MREKDWEILMVGDKIMRAMFEQPPLASSADPEPAPLSAVAHDTFQIVQIRNGVVTAVRLCERTKFHGSIRTVTEVVEIQREGALFDGSQLLPGHGMTCLWQWVPPARGEARLSGGFIVKRADGSEEHERCPPSANPR